MQYSMTCDQGHDPETLTVEAMGDEEAMGKMVAKAKEHFGMKHPGMAMGDDEMKAFIMGHWTKN